MPLRFGPGDIDGIFNALRPRFRKWISSGGFNTEPPSTVAPHTHQASDIGFDPAGVEWTGYLAADDVQDALEEHDDEKLARSGVQPMEGNLQMDDGLGPWEIYDILDLHLTGGVGNGIIDGVRHLQMAGDDADNEARIDQLDRVKFNATVTQAIIEDPARIEFQVGVTPGTDYTRAEGIVSWSDLEGIDVAGVESGA